MLVLVGLWAAIYMAGLSSAPLLDDADTVHAEAAREMLQRHDWVTLYVNGVRYLEKAPLMYWSVAASYKLFGISEWSTRFPAHAGRAGDDSGHVWAWDAGRLAARADSIRRWCWRLRSGHSCLRAF